MTDVNEVHEPKHAARPAAAAAGLPLRGLAMILIAVAVMLALWALYAFTKSNNGSSAAQSAVQSAGQPAQQPAQHPGLSAGESIAAAPVAPSAVPPASLAAPAPGAPAVPPVAPAPAVPGAPAPAANPAANPAELKTVNVLNNSTVPGLAADMSKKLQAEGYQVGQVGNFANQVLTETTVFFPAGNAAAEHEARVLAQKHGGVARVNIPGLPASPGLTLVLVSK